MVSINGELLLLHANSLVIVDAHVLGTNHLQVKTNDLSLRLKSHSNSVKRANMALRTASLYVSEADRV